MAHEMNGKVSVWKVWKLEKVNRGGLSVVEFGFVPRSPYWWLTGFNFCYTERQLTPFIKYGQKRVLSLNQIMLNVIVIKTKRNNMRYREPF